MHDFGFALGKQLRAGDFVVLSGQLGAGKTTFTQGLAAGLNVLGSVTSPTFVISRIHKSAGSGPNLVHVDAYRLNSPDQLMDLDLTDQENSVVVIEWGTPYISALTEDWLAIDISRESLIDSVDPAAGSRKVLVSAFGDRWRNLDLASLQ